MPGPMSELERYVFDTSGVLIRRGAIPSEEIERAVGLLEPILKPRVWKFPLLGRGEIFWDWLVRDELLRPAVEMCGPHARLDHAFGVCSTPQSGSVPQLHGGPDSSQLSCFYHDVGREVRVVGQLSAGVVLTGQSPRTGGFCYLPGSHHAARRIEGRDVYVRLLGHNLAHECLTVPTLDPGDLVFFSESLVHGDTGVRESNWKRLVAYYKFCPGWMCWRDPAQQEQYRPLARSRLARRLLEPPWTGRFDDSTDVMSPSNTRREPVYG
jgi:hypothetical protein